MLENVYGRWKKKFPQYQKSQDGVGVFSENNCCYTYIILRLWGEEEDNKDDESDDSSDELECDDDGGSVNGNNVTVRDEARDTIRIRGQVERDSMKDSMLLR